MHIGYERACVYVHMCFSNIAYEVAMEEMKTKHAAAIRKKEAQVRTSTTVSLFTIFSHFAQATLNCVFLLRLCN